MNRRFAPAGRLRGEVTPPADKSISHRAALIGAMCDEPVTVRNFLDAADTRSTLTAVLSLGAGVDEREGELVIRGVGLHGAFEPTNGTLDVGNAGTLMRLLPGWLAGQVSGRWTLDGDASIRRRPVGRIVEPLRSMGAQIAATDDRLPPLTVDGRSLRGIGHTLDVASAQVKTCLIFAGLLASGQTRVSEPSPSRDHTERMLARARAPVEREGLTVRMRPTDELELEEVVVPGDPSSAAFLVAAACLVGGSRVTLSGVGLNWTRTGFLRIAERMGAVIVGELEQPPPEAERAAGAEGFSRQGPAASPDSEPAGDIDVSAAPLEATTVEPDEVPLSVDELTLVALLGCFAEGETVVRGAEELRVKESDRIAGVVEGLRGLGADIEASDDGFAVRGGDGLRGGTFDARGDHRLAMLGAVAGLASRDGVEVEGMEAADISYPGFEDDLKALTRS
ncbi:MAG: 3-phosphoshikimate 1-carboxyvinyltransferase [uncultured Solirubrobacterales bacterium]|uniref:3-phosphoshikimate 1-carboxyvinyltransferase n=1 Tax=uncultured Solirubrobacterales bacterium TaxID=768556 RepID=A0A6J4SIW1_9ACTN|nr:MAG: 3-phosphoshikimate 1-carboxyvinyltransferase [uncultured Solirubrobacterales bacterium]